MIHPPESADVPVSLDPADHNVHYWWEPELCYRELGQIVTRHLKRTYEHHVTPGTRSYREKTVHRVMVGKKT